MADGYNAQVRYLRRDSNPLRRTQPAARQLVTGLFYRYNYTRRRCSPALVGLRIKAPSSIPDGPQKLGRGTGYADGFLLHCLNGTAYLANSIDAKCEGPISPELRCTATRCRSWNEGCGAFRWKHTPLAGTPQRLGEIRRPRFLDPERHHSRSRPWRRGRRGLHLRTYSFCHSASMVSQPAIAIASCRSAAFSLRLS